MTLELAKSIITKSGSFSGLKISKNLLTPKLSFRFNPSDMKNYSTTGRTIDANNAWAINRLGLSDTYESGRSLTLGLNYSNERKDKLNQINNYFEMKLATILRDKEEKFIPNKSTIHRKNSNLFAFEGAVQKPNGGGYPTSWLCSIYVDED